MAWPRGMDDRLCYGGDYNPEQWPERVWREDIALMKRAGVNLVTVGVFSWARLEPSEGEYEFDWLDRIMDRLAEAGIGVALATPTASPPPWFSFAHPDALVVTHDGVRLSHGSRDTYCVSAPAYRAACLRIALALGRRYAGHPALRMWHVHNEYGTTCYCDHVAAAFRRWLRERYGTLDALNEAWTAAFWSQTYHDWAHILPPRATQYLGNPGQLLDFRRFISDELLDCFLEQRDALRELTPDVPITTNFILGEWVPVDQWRWANEIDLIGIDHYPSSSDPLAAEEETAFFADLARGWAGGRPWLLIEQAPNLIYSGGRMIAKEPGRMTRLSLSHIARGSRGVMFFQWRGPRGGAERFHSAMVPHAGAGTRVFAEVASLGNLLARLGEVRDAGVEASVAIVWDAESRWALQGPGLPAPDLNHDEAARHAHATLWRLGVTCDIVRLCSDLSAYRLVVVPMVYLVSDEAAQVFTSYVESGGALLVWYFSGIAEPDGRIRLGGYPGALRDVLGIWVEEFHPLPEGATVMLSTGDTGQRWSELVHAKKAEVVAEYTSGPLAGHPAITRNAHGAGTAWYLSTWLGRDGLTKLFRVLLGGHPALANGLEGVEVVRRREGEHSWLFAINHTADGVEIPASGVDLASGEQVGGALSLPPGGFAILRESPGRGRESQTRGGRSRNRRALS